MLVAFAVGLLVAVVTTWPLARDLQTAARDTVDVPYEAWLLDWSGHAVTSSAHLLDANLFHPERAASMGADPLWGLGIPLAPLRWAGLSALGLHNAVLLLSLAMNVAAGYLAGRLIAGTRTTGAVLAAALSFGPFHTTESGHIQILFHPVLALAAVAAWRVADRIERDQSPVRPALVLGGLLAWQFTISLYIAVFAAVGAAVVLAVRVLMARPVPVRRLVAAVTSAAALPAVTAIAVGAAYGRRSEPLPSLDEALHQLGLLSGTLFETHPKLLVWGGLLGNGDGWFAFGGAFPGLTLSVLGAAGVVVGWRAADVVERRVARAAAALIAVGLVLTLGAAESGPSSYLPWRWVITVVPPLRGLRAMDRAMFVVLLGLGLAAGLAIQRASRSVRQVRAAVLTPVLTTVLTPVVVALVVVEGLASWAGLPALGPHPVDERLGSITAAGAVVYLPLPTSTEISVADWGQAEVALRTTAHHRPTVNGYGSYFPAPYITAKRALATFPRPSARSYLLDNDVRYVVLDRRASTGTPWEPLATGTSPVGWLQLVYEDDQDRLYRVTG